VGFIKGGIFRVYYTDINGEDINNVFLLKDDFIIGRLQAHAKILTNIQALVDSKVLVADMFKVFALAKKYHAVSQHILKIASYYFDKNVNREIKLRIQNATQNYLYFLKEYPNLINQIPHYYIADYLQISSTHLSRIRKELL